MDSAVLAVFVSVALGLPVLWLTWAIFRDTRRLDYDGRGLGLTEIADRLAVAVNEQWQSEAAVRRLNDPYPMSVAWEPADLSVQDTWASLIQLATTGAGATPVQEAASWAGGHDGLAGSGSDLVNVMRLVPTGRLVVLGEPGSGKTILMVRLVLDLLARRSAGDPVPVLASAASWDPSEHGLVEWLAGQMIADHPALSRAAPSPQERSTRAVALISAGLILPVIDGLDEISAAVRGPAIARINDAMRPGWHLVVTCRGTQYQDAVRPFDGADVTLRGAAVIQLLPLDPPTVRSYLTDDAGGPAILARWNPVLNLLGTDFPCAQALQSPLMVGLARAIYNPRPGERAGRMRDPAELCSNTYNDQSAIESHLFDAFIPAAYRSGSTRWKADKAEIWLTFLAAYLEKTARSPDLAWWKLHLAAPRWLNGVVITLTAAAMGGSLMGFAVGVNLGPGLGIQIGLGYTGILAVFTVWIAARTVPQPPARGFRWKLRGKFWPKKEAWNTQHDASQVKYAVRIGLLLAAGILVLAIGDAPLVDDMLAGIELILWALMTVISRGLETDTLDLSTAATPPAVIARDRSVATSAVLLIVTMSATMVTILTVVSGASPKLVSFFAVIYCGLIAPLLVEAIFEGTAWPSYVTTRACLAFRRLLPWSLAAFLDDAHRRGVMRQAGGVYQFRHLELQRRLAARPRNPSGREL